MLSTEDAVVTAEAGVTVTEELLATFGQATVPAQGLPATASSAPLASSGDPRFDAARTIILVNNGHPDFVFARAARRSSCITSSALHQGAQQAQFSPACRYNNCSSG